MPDRYKEVAFHGGMRDGVFSREATVTLSTYVYEPEDGEEPYQVVQIDTAPNVGLMRVYINDGTVYVGNPEVD